MLFEDVTMKENIYSLIGALENESEEGVCDENEILAKVFEELEKLENGKDIKRTIREVLELTSLNFFRAVSLYPCGYWNFNRFKDCECCLK